MKKKQKTKNKKQPNHKLNATFWIVQETLGCVVCFRAGLRCEGIKNMEQELKK